MVSPIIFPSGGYPPTKKAGDVVQQAGVTTDLPTGTTELAQQNYQTQMNVKNSMTPSSNSSSGSGESKAPQRMSALDFLKANGAFVTKSLEKGVKVKPADDSEYWSALGYNA